MPRLDDPVNAWASVHLRLGPLLHDPGVADFADRLKAAQARLAELLDSDVDDSLLTLLYGASHEAVDYSATHATLVAAICQLASRHLPDWDPAWAEPMRCAALAMNVAMTDVQNQLALQVGPITPRQRQLIDGHAAAGVELLRAAGIDDELVLGAVASHHDAPPGPLAALPPAGRIARLIRRADRFCAQISPRRARAALAVQAAAKTAYLDENGEPDLAGSAILKAIGLYPAGSLVRLRSGEVGVVLRRGARPNAPVVAVIASAKGMALADPVVRRGAIAAHEVASAVAPAEVKVLISPQRLLALSS